jgi:hypothetical protein
LAGFVGGMSIFRHARMWKIRDNGAAKNEQSATNPERQLLFRPIHVSAVELVCNAYPNPATKGDYPAN